MQSDTYPANGGDSNRPAAQPAADPGRTADRLLPPKKRRGREGHPTSSPLSASAPAGLPTASPQCEGASPSPPAFAELLQTKDGVSLQNIRAILFCL